MYKEIKVHPLITCGKVDSPTDPKAKWKQIVSVPTHTLASPAPQQSHARLFGVGDWLVVVWSKKEGVSRKAEIVLYEASKGEMPPRIDEFGNARIRALSKQDWISLIEVQLPIGQTRNRRYSGAIVEGEVSIQIWTKVQ